VVESGEKNQKVGMFLNSYLNKLRFIDVLG